MTSQVDSLNSHISPLVHEETHKEITTNKEYQEIVKQISQIANKSIDHPDIQTLYNRAQSYRSKFEAEKIVEYTGGFLKKIVMFISKLFQKGIGFAFSATYLQVESLDIFTNNRRNKNILTSPKGELHSEGQSKTPSVEPTPSDIVVEPTPSNTVPEVPCVEKDISAMPAFNPIDSKNHQLDARAIKKLLESSQSLDDTTIFLVNERPISNVLGDSSLFAYQFKPPASKSKGWLSPFFKDNWKRTRYNTLIENRSSEQINQLFKNMQHSLKVIESKTRCGDGLIDLYEAVDARAYDTQAIDAILEKIFIDISPVTEKSFYAFHVNIKTKKTLFRDSVDEGLCVTTASWNSEQKSHDIQTDLITMNREAERFLIGDMEFDSIEHVQKYYADKYVHFNTLQPPKEA
ncbi:MAG: hypothetical protein QRY74_00840 [Chlamydia sp.]